MIRLHCSKWAYVAKKEGTMKGQLNIIQKHLSWEIWLRMMNYHTCTGMGKVLRKTRKSFSIIWKRLQLAVILQQDTILDVMMKTMEGTTEHLNIGSSLPIRDLMRHWRW